jgi:hypothetical protein
MRSMVRAQIIMLTHFAPRHGQDSAHRKKPSANYRLCFDIGPAPDSVRTDGIQFIDGDEMGGFGLRMAKKKRKR